MQEITIIRTSIIGIKKRCIMPGSITIIGMYSSYKICLFDINVMSQNKIWFIILWLIFKYKAAVGFRSNQSPVFIYLSKLFFFFFTSVYECLSGFLSLCYCTTILCYVFSSWTVFLFLPFLATKPTSVECYENEHNKHKII